MAAVSAWSKPGAWALEAEEHEAMEQQKEKEKEKGYSSSDSYQSSDFPSLSAVAMVKTSKKKKKQTFSLAEFASGAAEPKKFQPSSRSNSAAVAEALVLPTGPRERSAEELDRSRGFGLRGGFGRESRDEPRREREPREPMGPSRADEVDDWGATKRSVVPERRERGGGGGGGGASFFDSQSRADESDSWVSKKSAPPPPPMVSRRSNSGGGRGYEMFNREGPNGVDSGSWGKKREEIGYGAPAGSGGRPRIVLQPRSVPLVNESNGDTPLSSAGGKSKGANPFGEARPREEVLKEKGKDWKEIDEKLDAVKSQEAPLVERKGFGIGSAGPREHRTERAWRKPDALAASPPERDVKVEQVPEN